MARCAEPHSWLAIGIGSPFEPIARLLLHLMPFSFSSADELLLLIAVLSFLLADSLAVTVLSVVIG